MMKDICLNGMIKIDLIDSFFAWRESLEKTMSPPSGLFIIEIAQLLL